MKHKIVMNFKKKSWKLKEDFKTSNRSENTSEVLAIEVILKKNEQKTLGSFITSEKKFEFI